MPAPASVDELLDLVQRSGVADAARLKAYIARLAEKRAMPTEPAKLAGMLVRDGLLTYFQAEQILQGKWKRFSLGKYKVLEKLGSGGMGTVFLCEHKLMRRRVAIKVLPTAKATDEASLGRFYREARAVAAVDHPNIVRAYDIDQDENLHFLVMEYVDGTNLQDLVKKFGALDPVRACHYVYGAAVGLQHAHEIGLVHRDIKPGNILLDRSGVVKLLDMGLARFFHDSEDNLTRQYDENILGTADYLSPEQAEDSHTVDIRSDIYSLGATFYFMLTGSQPFPEGTIPQKLIWHRNREPRPVKSLRPEVPDEVVAIVSKMMAKKPEDRYQTPAEVMAALSSWASTPIPPPADREMPQLSPAAAAAVGGGGGGQRPGSGSSPRSLNSPVPLIGSGDHAAYRGPTGGSGTADSGPDTASDAVWESIGDGPGDTPANTGRRLRTPPPAPKSDHGRQQPSPGEPAKRRFPLALVAVGVLILCGAAAGAYFLFFNKKPTDTPAPPNRARLVVSKAGAAAGVENTFSSLAAAVQRAIPGDTITVAESPLTESTLLLSRIKNITIESGLPGGKPVVIEFSSPRQGAAALAMIDLASTENVRLKNLELDGKGVADVGVVVSGPAAGVTVENVTVRNVKAAPFRLYNVAGDPARPLTLDRVRAVLTPTCEAGVKVEATKLDSRNIAIRNSRIEGPGKAGIKFDGSVVAAEVSGNRLYKLDTAFLIAGVEGKAVRAQFTQNTVYEAQTGFQFTGVKAGKTEIGVNRNYFANTKKLAQIDGASPAGVTSVDNGFHDPADGNAELKAVPVNAPQLPQPNPDDDTTFLRFPAATPPMVGSARIGAN